MAKLEGSSDFTTAESTVTLNPKGKAGSTGKLLVRFAPRFSHSVEGRLILTADAAGSATNASTMVFLLRSNIQSQKCAVVHTVEAPCYEAVEKVLHITNTFSADCIFNVSLTPLAHPLALPLTNGKGKQGKQKKGKIAVAALADLVSKASITAEGGTSVESGVEQEKEFAPPPSFWTHQDKLKIKAGETVTFRVTFLPFRMGEHRANLTFLDEKSGEFMHEIAGAASLPHPMEPVPWKLTEVGPSTQSILLPVKNPGFDKARVLALELAAQSKQYKVNAYPHHHLYDNHHHHHSQHHHHHH
jgi:hypothetical protein